ncbi:MAG TPA: hypothetical protein EYQ69_09625, partial [Gemmatimonadetes bacterium]|nr:hypothetical protein [Gemmatimonadota bacterium]
MDDSPASAKSPESPSSLESLREKVNHADKLLLDALIKRFRVAEEIGTYKSRKKASSFDQIREAEIVRRAHRVAQKAGVPWTYRFFLAVKHRRKEDTDRIQELLMVSATRVAVVGIFRTA